MPNTPRTLSALLALYASGTGGITAQNARDWLVSVNALTGPEVAVTGAATATLGQMHACSDSGTPANYTLALPSPTGNAGSFLGVRVSPSMMKLVTVDAGSGVSIDGQRTRVMWAGESAILSCDGSTWYKIGGKSIPMQARIEATASQTLSVSTFNAMTLSSVAWDIGGLTPVTADTLTCQRGGHYLAMVGGTVLNIGGNQPILYSLYLNGSEWRRLFRGPPDAGGAGGAGAAAPVPLQAGDALRFWVYIGTGSAPSTEYLAGGVSVMSLSLAEVSPW